MASLTDELSPSERLSMKQKAYDKFINVANPAMAEKSRLQNTQIGGDALRNVYKGIKEGGYSGRETASQALDQGQLELAKASGQQASEQDTLNVQGANMKEAIIGDRQKNALAAFNRRTQDMEDAMDRAITERAFDMGMTSKELAFHSNAKIADIGLENLQKDYEAGNVSKIELQRVADNLAREAAADKMEADNMLAQLRREGKAATSREARRRALELSLDILNKQKDALKKANKASNMAAIITGTFQIGGAVIGGVYGGPAGAAGGSALGAGIGAAVSSKAGSGAMGDTLANL